MLIGSAVDVAWRMEVSKPRVSHAVATLRDGGFLTMDSDYFLHLTDIGREVAEQIYEKHRFFTERLIAAGVDPKTAEADMCQIKDIPVKDFWSVKMKNAELVRLADRLALASGFAMVLALQRVNPAAMKRYTFHTASH